MSNQLEIAVQPDGSFILFFSILFFVSCRWLKEKKPASLRHCRRPVTSPKLVQKYDDRPFPALHCRRSQLFRHH